MAIRKMISRTLISYKRNIRRFVDDIFERLFKSGMFSLTVITFVWIAVFLYVIFYYTYVPISSHVRPIHLQIAACDDNFKLCAYPSAHVRLTKRNQLLMKGQQYKFRIQLEMPESPVNMKLGMFMVCVQLKDKIGFLTSQSCRSNMLHYSSDIIQKSKIIVFFPLFLFGGKEEKQIVNFELYSDFTEDQNHPVTDVYVEVQTRNIELYSANLYINAHLVGLRYFMYHWPITSAIFGISISLFVIFFTMSLSFYHNFFVNTVPVQIVRSQFKKLENQSEKFFQNRTLQPSNLFKFLFTLLNLMIQLARSMQVLRCEICFKIGKTLPRSRSAGNIKYYSEADVKSVKVSSSRSLDRSKKITKN